MKLEHTKLSYARDDLEPSVSKETIDYHYGESYGGYVKRFNKGEGDPDFNEAGAFLHDIYFTQFQSPSNTNTPSGSISEFINKHFKSFEKFKDEFEKIAMGIQGSGWAYLAKDGEIKTIKNHEIKKDIVVLVDWWEHAWALDYQADKKKYLENQWKIINWNVISARLGLVQERHSSGGFVKELHEARLIRTVDDLKYSYSEVCENLMLIVLTLDMLSRLKEGKDLAERYARQTASYINYTEFRVSATDLYNFVYFVQAEPDTVQLLFGSEDSKRMRIQTQLPRMELNRWLMQVSSPNSKDLYFFLKLEQALNVKSSEIKDIRRMLSFHNPSISDLRSIALKILTLVRQRMPLFDFRNEIEQVLSSGKYTYIK